LLGLVVATPYILTAQAFYKSTARILVDRSTNRYLQTNKIVHEPVFDQAELASQVHILSSESIIIPVVRSLDLVRDDEFVGPPATFSERMKWRLNKLVSAVRRTIAWNDEGNLDAVDRDAVRERVVIEVFLKRLSVYREDVANVINVTFASTDPNKAARIANAIADTYVATIQEAKSESTRIASKLLQDRLMELKVQAIETDRALQKYKASHDLEETKKGLPVSEQLSDVRAELTKVRVSMAEIKARLDRIQHVSDGGAETLPVTDASSDSIIVKLRTEYMDLTKREAEISPNVVPEHSALIKLRRRMAELRLAIRGEEERLATIEYQNAKAREQELIATVEQLQAEAKIKSEAQVTMRHLESAAETSRNLYSSLLQKFRELDSAPAQSLGVQDVRIVTRAAAPLQKSSSKAMLVLGASVAVGLFLGAGAAIGREWMADVFRTPDAITQVTGIYGVTLPIATKTHKRTGSSQGSIEPMQIQEFVLDEPYSRFTETLRTVKALLNAAGRDGGCKVIGVVSSVAKEGKTTIAANLGALMIASSGAGTRGLIVDGDLHLRNLTARLAPDAREGLIEALANPSRLAAVVSKRPRSGLDVLPCVLPARLPNAAELLASPQMGELLAVARKSYDFVMIEVAPIMSVVDVKMIERFVDQFIFVVEWGQTKRRLVLEALSDAEMIGERIVCIILNKADPSALRSLEAYKGGRFKDYYEA
jgi:succinoglycan biosynthesis transport protein ExoP